MRAALPVAMLAAALLVACERRDVSVAEPTAAPRQKQVLRFDEALIQAQQKRLPVVVDFHAPWCYSCYYMATHVLNGPEWAAVGARALIVEIDADAPTGAAIKERYGVRALPSYLVLDADGSELGRILGEQTRVQFYDQLNALLDRGSSLDQLLRQVEDAQPASIAAARLLLQSYHARYDADAALAWHAQLEPDLRDALAADAEADQWLARLRFMAAAQREDRDACLVSGQIVLAGALGCARAYELNRYLGCADAGAAELLAAQRAPLYALVETGVFGDSPCADERSVVLVAAQLEAALGDREAETAVLRRAIDDVERRIDGDLRRDRNLADNLRVYVERLASVSGDYARLDTLMPKLIEAWPQDYVYTFRHGRSLVARQRAADALPFLEQAAQHAYGINRIRVAEQRVLALQALEREDDARRVVGETLRANGPWFPEDVQKLKAMLRASS